MSDATSVLMTLLVIALLVERAVAVLSRAYFGPRADPALGSEEWGRGQVVLASAISLMVCWQYKYDVFSSLLDSPGSVPFGGFVGTSVVMAGGSAGNLCSIEGGQNGSYRTISPDCSSSGRLTSCSRRLPAGIAQKGQGQRAGRLDVRGGDRQTRFARQRSSMPP
jgi:hypothetical protein